MENKTRSRVMMAITLFSAIVLSGTVFVCAKRAGEEVTQRSFDELTTATKELAKDINNATRTDQTILSAMAELIAGQDEDDLDSVLRIMNTFSLDKTFVSAVALLRPDGTLLLTDGARYDVSDTFDFETEAARGAYISDRVTSYFAPEKLVVRNVVPVKRDGETIAILYGVVLLQELSRNYQIDLYNGNAVLLLVDGNNGDILLDTWHDSLGNLSDLRGRKMLKGYTYEETMEKIPNGIGGDMCIVSRSTGLTIYLHYEPVGINNWSVVLGVSEQDALAGTRGVVKILYLMSVIVGVILLSYLAYISWYLISARRSAFRMSVTDQVTGLFNRSAFEKYLNESEPHTFSHTVCVYIDVNGLHELNNKHGHEAGDKLLQSVAECLRAQFPDDGLYRIGGDEFVVFSKADAAVCEARMQAVSSALAAQDYSISYGIAAQETTEGLSDLVREADENMLKNKRRYYAEHDRRRPR
jgi:diguanylate cyclase (GGDEF)-like protein